MSEKLQEENQTLQQLTSDQRSQIDVSTGLYPKWNQTTMGLMWTASAGKVRSTG